MSAPRSDQFNDIYFSVEDGLAETRHVFLAGNNLSAAWQGHDVYHIAETGFGTGLNFLATAALFLQTSGPHQHLVFSSIEKYPLQSHTIRAALAHWAGEFNGLLDQLCDHLPLRVWGEHPIRLHPRITLILHYGDVQAGVQALAAPVNAWFLDGFSPAKNPEMWQDYVFDAMRDKSAIGARCATFTAAGFVKRGLQRAGFQVEKIKGFGRKREMLRGQLSDGAGMSIPRPQIRNIGILGGGLAGCAMADWARHYGIAATIYEAGDRLACGASGNPIGLFNPRFSQSWGAEGHLYASAFALLARHTPPLRRGNLHLLTTPEKTRRLHGFAANWGWHSDHVQLLDADQASDLAGVRLAHAALYLPDGGAASPVDLCQKWAGQTPVRLQEVPDLEVLRGAHDAIVLANGVAAKTYIPHLPLQTVRGQIIRVAAHPGSSPLRCALQYGGYITPPLAGSHVVGATFQPWLTDTAVRDEDTTLILQNLHDAVPAMAAQWEVLDARASLRTTTPARAPLIGQCASDMYVSTAHGSHGLITSFWAGWEIVKALRFDWAIKSL